MTDRPTNQLIVWFDEYQETDHERVGGKAASLGTMTRAGLLVPPGFAIATDAYDTLRSHEELRTTVNDALARVDQHDPRSLREASRVARQAIEQLELPEDIADAIATAYEALCEQCGVDDVPVAVRSSATAEDLPDASFAGQQDTYLWVRGVHDVLEHVRRCWSSTFTDRAIAYRHRTGHDHEVLSMAVVVQKMVEPVAAGVAFTLNPTDGDRSQIAIDASWGFGEAVVGGEVTPDNFLVDKVLREVTSRKISPKSIEYALVEDRVVKVEVDEDRANEQCLTDEQVCAVAAMARRAERHYGCPQDVEWAVDRHLPDGDDVVLLQSRPETVWSNRSRPTTTTVGLESIVRTLMSPLAAKRREEASADTTAAGHPG